MENQGANVVMNVFNSFANKQPTKIRITKIGNVDGRPHAVPIGQVVEGMLAIGNLEVGISFNLSNATVVEGDVNCERNNKGVTYPYWRTSIIKKILSHDTFETKNSIYKWEII